VPPTGDIREFAFLHRLTCDAAYRALLASNRRALHSAAADALLGGLRFGTPDEAPRLAQLIGHLRRAERWGEAHRYSCKLLQRRANLGRVDGWEEQAAAAQELWERARQADPALPPRTAALCNAWAMYLAMTGRPAQAQPWSEQALGLARAAGDAEQTALALNSGGMAAHYSGELATALDRYRAGLDACRAAGDRLGQMRALNNIGLLLNEQGDNAPAERALREGLALAQADGALLLESNLALNLGIVLGDLEQLEEARAQYEHAYQTGTQCGDLSTQGLAIGNIGGIDSMAGRKPEARAAFVRAAELARDIRAPRFIAFWTNELAELELHEGRTLEALALAEQAAAAARGCGDRLMCGYVLCSAGAVALAAGQPERARALLAEARAAVGAIPLTGLERLTNRFDDLQAQLATQAEPDSTQP
jgi:tetratricopeptide (TPR) repeat protein